MAFSILKRNQAKAESVPHAPEDNASVESPSINPSFRRHVSRLVRSAPTASSAQALETLAKIKNPKSLAMLRIEEGTF